MINFTVMKAITITPLLYIHCQSTNTVAQKLKQM